MLKVFIISAYEHKFNVNPFYFTVSAEQSDCKFCCFWRYLIVIVSLYFAFMFLLRNAGSSMCNNWDQPRKDFIKFSNWPIKNKLRFNEVAIWIKLFFSIFVVIFSYAFSRSIYAFTSTHMIYCLLRRTYLGSLLLFPNLLFSSF